MSVLDTHEGADTCSAPVRLLNKRFSIAMSGYHSSLGVHSTPSEPVMKYSQFDV